MDALFSLRIVSVVIMGNIGFLYKKWGVYSAI